MLEFIIRARVNHSNSSTVQRMCETATASTRGVFIEPSSAKHTHRTLASELILTNEDGNGENDGVQAVLNSESYKEKYKNAAWGASVCCHN